MLCLDVINQLESFKNKWYSLFSKKTTHYSVVDLVGGVCLAQDGITTRTRPSVGSRGPCLSLEKYSSRQRFCNNTMQGLCDTTAARAPLHRSFQVSATTAHRPAIYHRRYRPSLPSSHPQCGVPTTSHLLTILVTFLISSSTIS